MGTGSFPGVKRTGYGINHPPLYNAEVKERVELYLSSLCGPAWTVLGHTLPSLNTPVSSLVKEWRLGEVKMSKSGLVCEKTFSVSTGLNGNGVRWASHLHVVPMKRIL